jgi:hypothetical protein
MADGKLNCIEWNKKTESIREAGHFEPVGVTTPIPIILPKSASLGRQVRAGEAE